MGTQAAKTTLALLVLLAASPAFAILLDRVAVIVGTRVITEQQLLREIRLESLYSQQPVDYSSVAKRRAAQRLVERLLILNEMELNRYPMPSEQEVNLALQSFISQRFNSTREYEQALKTYQVSEEHLKEFLRQQIAILRFIEYRFRPAVFVSDEEVQAALKHALEENTSSANGKTLTAAQRQSLEDQMREKLIHQKIDQELDRWLKEAKQQVRIDFKQEVFQ